MNKEIYTVDLPTKIIVGVNSFAKITDVIKQYSAKKVAVITDYTVWKSGSLDGVMASFKAAGIGAEVFSDLHAEPEVAKVKEVYNHMKDTGCEILMGVGGGSTLDVAKLLAVLMTNERFLENIFDNSLIKSKGIPMILVPTTAGTGAETTPNAIILDPDQKLKIGIVSERLIPDVVILDPALTEKLPPAVTASTGIDAFCHAIECYTSKKANQFSDTFALKAINLISKSIRRAYQNGSDLEARNDMILGAMFAGICITASGTTAVHALSYPLGGTYRIAHGVSNAMLLPYVMAYNRDMLEDKFADVAGAMELDVCGLSKTEISEEVVRALFTLVEDVGIECDLKKYGVTERDLDELSEAAYGVKRLLDNNPKPLEIEDIKKIYSKLL